MLFEDFSQLSLTAQFKYINKRITGPQPENDPFAEQCDLARERYFNGEITLDELHDLTSIPYSFE